MKKIKRIIALITIIIFVFTGTTFATEEYNFSNLMFESLKQYIMNYYKGDASEAELLDGALNKIFENHPEVLEKAIEGMFEPLDEHSTYFNKEEYDSFSDNMSGEFGGIGISVENKNGYITIVAPIENTPGHRAGLKSGDKIVFVNDIDISGYDTNMAVSMMRGEPGTEIKLGIKRDGIKEILHFTITRAIIPLNPVNHKVLEDDIGYIQISDFNAKIDEYFTKALDEFDAEGIQNLIIDVRYNPGGSLSQVIRVAEKLIPKGPIVHIDYKDPEYKETFFSELSQAKYENIVVLINEGSASASEILAGAIQDTGAGIIVGEKSFGKGTVQQVIPIKTGGAIKLTIAKYLTPNETIIDGDGIRPDIKVKNTTEKVNVDELEELSFRKKLSLGEKEKDVLAAEQRLNLLGYDVGEPDEVFDERTFDAVRAFQEEQKLFPYGVLDINTQIAIHNSVYNVEVLVDHQLEKAIEILQSK